MIFFHYNEQFRRAPMEDLRTSAMTISNQLYALTNSYM